MADSIQSKRSIQVNKAQGNEMVQNATLKMFDPANLKKYHAILVVLIIVIIYLFFTDNDRFIFIKAVGFMALLFVTIAESIIIFTYLDINKKPE